MNTTDKTVPENTAFSLFSSDSGELAENPFPSLVQLRSMGAVVPLPFPFAGTGRQTWVVTRMEEVVQGPKDPAHFTVDASSIGIGSFLERNAAETADAPTF